jgi:hypothetical protein
MSAAPPLVYISYSHKDAVWLDKLLIWLNPMEADGQIRLFHDRTLSAGVDLDQAFESNLQDAALGIVLLSQNWLASDFTNKREFPVLSSRRHQGPRRCRRLPQTPGHGRSGPARF